MKNEIKTKTLLIIDPYLKFPELEAFNFVSTIFARCQLDPEFALNKIQYVSPVLPYDEMDETALSENIGAVIGLGSEANVTDHAHLAWFPRYKHWTMTLAFERKIPFFGICFAHQAMAFFNGGEVDYVKRLGCADKIRFEKPRSIEVIHKKLGEINGQKTHFVSEVIHEQEVVSPPKGFLHAATSEECKYDGFVHETLPIYTVQSHPETENSSGDGHALIMEFLKLSSRTLIQNSSL